MTTPLSIETDQSAVALGRVGAGRIQSGGGVDILRYDRTPCQLRTLATVRLPHTARCLSDLKERAGSPR